MKFICVLLLITFVQASAASYAQRVSLDRKDAPIKEVFKDISKQTGYNFIISSDLAQQAGTISIKVKNAPLREALDKCFTNQPLEYVINKKIIVVKKRVSSKTQTPAAPLPVSGQVTDEKGEPLPGVTVQVKGAAVGTTTDANGRYAIQVPDENATLVFSYIGYDPKEVAVKNRTTINESLAPDAKALDEVVVVGYGEVRKSDITGAIAQYKNVDVAERPALSASQMLQGRVAGVQISQNTGAPGAASTFSIRGASTLGSSQPLFVIDGFPIDNNYVNPTNVEQGTSYTAGSIPPTDVLSTLNPNEIESIEILKDASATAIYGSRGANGVVIITTKSGKAGQTKIQYNFRQDISQLPKQIKVLGTADFINYMNEGAKNDGMEAVYEPEEEGALMTTQSVNWQEEIYRTGVSRDHQLTISGGDAKTKYAVIGGYVDNNGIVKNTNYNRASLRLNFSREVTRRLNFDISIAGSLNKNTRQPQGHSGSVVSGSVVGGALYRRPFDQPYNTADEANDDIVDNPITIINKQTDLLTMTQLLPSLNLEYKFTDFLKLRYKVGMNFNKTIRDLYYPRGTSAGNGSGGKAYYDTGENQSLLSDLTLNLTKTLAGKHYVNATVGYNWQEWQGRSFSIASLGFPNDLLKGNNLGLASSSMPPRSGRYTAALASFIGRAVYTYDQRYVLTVTGRADGSTRLAAGHKWDYFPAIAGAWNVHQERFFNQGNNLVSQLKLRASYGFSGRQSVGIGASQERMGLEKGHLGDDWVTAVKYGSISNPNLGWERTKQTNLGFDIGFRGSRYTLSADIYQKNSIDMLIGLPIPLSTGFGSYTANGGEIANKGLELEASAQVLPNAFKWRVSGNFTLNRNKVISLGGPQTMFGRAYYSSAGDNINMPISVVMPGHPIGEFYGYKINGIYQDTLETKAGPEPNARPGDFKFVDLSGPDGKPDGIINDFDKTFIGNPYPDFTFGLNNDFQYKNLSLSVFWQGNIGQEVANLNRVYLDALSNTTNNNVRQEAYDNRWTGPGTSNYFPRANAQKPIFKGRLSDFLIEDASFVRLKTVIVSYHIPLPKYLKSVKVFASANNLLTFTKYSGYDPEVSIYGNSAIDQGIDLTAIPNTRTFSFGVNASF